MIPIPDLARRAVALVVLLPLVACTAAEPESSEWRAYADRLPEAGVRERFVEATALLLDVPYENGPLGEGDAGGPDPDPRVDFARADCVTYLEQALALAVTPRPAGSEPGGDDFLRVLDAIRYSGGEVGFITRNHYMVADWIPANAWLLEDVTAEIAEGRTESVTRVIDRATFLRDQGVEPREGVDGMATHTVAIVPVAAIDEVAPRIAPGDLVFWIGSAAGIFVLHTGLAVRDDSGRLVFRHASSRAGRALEEPFTDYAESTSFLGFLVLRVKESPAAPGVLG